MWIQDFGPERMCLKSNPGPTPIQRLSQGISESGELNASVREVGVTIQPFAPGRN